MNEKSKTIFLYLISLIIIAVFIFITFQIEGNNEKKEIQSNNNIVSSNEISNNENLSNKPQEYQEVVKIIENDVLPTPDRIIYKNLMNEYIIITPDEVEYPKIYNELYNRITTKIDGKVISEDEISNMQTKGSFIEFDYNTKSKNFVFMLDEAEIGIIKRFTDSGQVIQNYLSNVEDLKSYMDRVVENRTTYNFEKNYNYTSIIKTENIPNDFEQKRFGVYQKIIKDNSTDYENTVELLKLNSSETLSNVDFLKQSAIITISQYEIKSIKQNIGNIKYEFGVRNNNFIVNVLIVSKVVNANCIYYNVSDSLDSSQGGTTQLSNIVNMTTTGIIKNVGNNKIEIGLSDTYSTYMASIDSTTTIVNYETNEIMKLSDLQKGDLIYVFGEIMRDIDGLKGVKASQIEICRKQKAKTEIEKFLKDTYRIDSMSIGYSNVDSSGNGYIIINCCYEKFNYPIILNVNTQTETFLGMSYHLQSNYGYILHEICDITLSDKITDIDNIRGTVRTIEYIAD